MPLSAALASTSSLKKSDNHNIVGVQVLYDARRSFKRREAGLLQCCKLHEGRQIDMSLCRVCDRLSHRRVESRLTQNLNVEC